MDLWRVLLSQVFAGVKGPCELLETLLVLVRLLAFADEYAADAIKTKKVLISNTTNTFRTNCSAIIKNGLKSYEADRAAVIL